LKPPIVVTNWPAGTPVVVVVDEARHDRAPVEVDHLLAAVVDEAGVLADRRELVVVDRHARDDAVLGVHRVDDAVDEHGVAAVRAAIAVVVVGPRGARQHGEQGGQNARARAPSGRNSAQGHLVVSSFAAIGSAACGPR
jgi:hypothetical protein